LTQIVNCNFIQYAALVVDVVASSSRPIEPTPSAFPNFKLFN